MSTAATDATGWAIAATVGTNSCLSLGAWLTRGPTIIRVTVVSGATNGSPLL